MEREGESPGTADIDRQVLAERAYEKAYEVTSCARFRQQYKTPTENRCATQKAEVSSINTKKDNKTDRRMKGTLGQAAPPAVRWYLLPRGSVMLYTSST